MLIVPLTFRFLLPTLTTVGTCTPVQERQSTVYTQQEPETSISKFSRIRVSHENYSSPQIDPVQKDQGSISTQLKQDISSLFSFSQICESLQKYAPAQIEFTSSHECSNPKDLKASMLYSVGPESLHNAPGYPKHSISTLAAANTTQVAGLGVDPFATGAVTAPTYRGLATTPQSQEEEAANNFSSIWFEQPPVEQVPVYRQLILPRIINTNFQKSKSAKHIWYPISQFVAALDALNPWYSFSQVSLKTRLVNFSNLVKDSHLLGDLLTVTATI